MITPIFGIVRPCLSYDGTGNWHFFNLIGILKNNKNLKYINISLCSQVFTIYVYIHVPEISSFTTDDISPCAVSTFG